LIFNHFSEAKIKKIINKEIPPDFFAEKDMARYNCKVDEIANSPTYRAYNFTILASLAEKYPIPPEMLLESSDLPQETKDKLSQSMQASQQAQQEAQQFEQQKEIHKMQIEQKEIELEEMRVQIEAFKANMKLDELGMQQERVDAEKVRTAVTAAESIDRPEEVNG